MSLQRFIISFSKLCSPINENLRDKLKNFYRQKSEKLGNKRVQKLKHPEFVLFGEKNPQIRTFPG
jgi:hypothetical protein